MLKNTSSGHRVKSNKLQDLQISIDQLQYPEKNYDEVLKNQCLVDQV